MIPVITRSSQHINVFGLGASGRAAAHALVAGGAVVSAWDDDAKSRKNLIYDNTNISLKNPLSEDFSGIDALLLSPGIPLTLPAPHPVVTMMRDAGIPIIGDIELLVENATKATLIGVTGTNGKSTTSALIHHVLQIAKVPVQIGGNFGPPVLGLEPVCEDDTIVLELSSYQLDLTENAAFDFAVFLNITPDHLDRHGNIEGYVSAKKQIFRQSPKRHQIAIIGIDDSHGQAIYAELTTNPAWKVVPISTVQNLDDGIYIRDGVLYDTENHEYNLNGIDSLRGQHNWQNAAAAWAVARGCNIPGDVIASAFKTFTGLPHRLENVGDFGGVRYINDSKATNGEASARALSSYTNIFWIAGGIAKEDGLNATFSYLDRVRHVFLIGEAADPFATTLGGRGIPFTKSGNLNLALEHARNAATADPKGMPVVLLSPACASFDQYLNFADRGDHFRDLVEMMVGEENTE
ncbi:MAG: UDP-N-acetylmuramoyl-L-alanine--D-glutamate ligase [Pseudomonadota bacterium]|nr:UDP-N-acetylmuramoyl-L-alanine--D-glutamate ligase [Pseudomonadota bacterium]